MLLEIASITSLVVAIAALVFSFILLLNPAARSGLVSYVFLFLFLTALSYTLHASIEVFGTTIGMSEALTEQLYAVTSVVASLFVFFLVVMIQVIAKLLVKR